MSSLSDADAEKLIELLQETGEFFSYFELAEKKMMEWRYEIEQKLRHQQHCYDKFLSYKKN